MIETVLGGLVCIVVVLIANGRFRFTTGRQLESVRTFREQLEEYDHEVNHFADAMKKSLGVTSPPPVVDPTLVTQTWVLQWLPPEIAADFDCPTGAHAWVGIHEFRWCQHCPKQRRIPCPGTDRPAADVIYDLQFKPSA